MTSAVDILQSYGNRLQPVLSRYFDSKIEEAWHLSPDCHQMLLHIKDFTLRGGKRIRPALVYYGYRCFEQDRDDELLLASLCVEILHSYLLIHDDIMDHDDLRRGFPTVHKIYADSPNADNYDSNDSYGMAMAIIAGDMASAMAVDVLAAPTFPPERQVKAIRKLTEIAVNVCHGQALDMISAGRPNHSTSDAALVNKLKTACYTVEGPLHIGGILAGASDEHLKAFSDYANPLGQAFQIMDDILGLYGDQQQIGKPVGSDLKEGKKTLLILKALELANKDQAAVINSVLGNSAVTEADVAGVQSVVRETGALEFCRQLARSMVEQGKSALPTDLTTEGREFLLAVADYIVSRDS